jgi:hypothetical protein
MPINFTPNDPLTETLSPTRAVAPRPDRSAGQAGFTFLGASAEGQFPAGSPQRLFWQCREAALLAVEVWEGLNGPLTLWSTEAVNRKKLLLIEDAGDQLNAGYNRESLSFFHHATNGHTTFSGASTDVVTHEAGHAFLDTLRPELFGTASTEDGAFHEAFGDCMALLVALSDDQIRTALLAQSSNLSTPNFVETLMEDLADGVKRAFGPTNPSAEPRRALNNFMFALPTTLPTTGGPAVLTSEGHSFSRVFTGCFYDLIRNLFAATPAPDSAALLNASQTAGKMLIEAAKKAPASLRFFQSVGRTMVLNDDAVGGGHREAISKAFSGHGVFLGSSSMLMPKMALSGRAPVAARKSGGLGADTLADIRRRIDAPRGARLSVSALALGPTPLVEALHHREVALGSLGKELKGVVAIAPESVLVGASAGAAAAFSAMPDATATTDEVLKFVETLLAHDRVGLHGKSVRAGTSKKSHAAGARLEPLPTHVVKARAGKKVLTRVRFLCGCHR